MTKSNAPGPRPAMDPARPGGSARGSHGMVVTTDRYASEIGLGVLRAGGNAVDAAVAVSFALAVVNPEAGNVAGGGFLLSRSPEGEVRALDYRSRAPLRAGRETFSRAPEDAPVTGPLAAAVPGAVRGLWEAHARSGRVAWDELVDPAVQLAHGFEVGRRFVASYTHDVIRALRAFPESARIFLPRDGGHPPRVGDVFRQPDLARSLERIRDRGADGFYDGVTADRIVSEMERSGGLIGRADLTAYRSSWREPVRIPYRGHTVVSMPPSSSGGVTLAAAFGILRRFSLRDLDRHGAEHIHLLAESWKRAYADRNHYLADPEFVSIPIDVLTSSAYAAWRAQAIDPGRATPSDQVEPGVEAYRGIRRDARPGRGSAPEGRHTTHASIVDADGGAVSLTTTLNTWYGSKVVVPGTGILLNNEMDDFTTVPGRPNFFGLIQGEANAVEPGKRMLSAMTPTFVLSADEALRLVIGSPGGATIITTVLQVVSNVIDFGLSLGEAVRAPRVHHQHLPDRIELEPDAPAPDVEPALRALGHALHRRDEPWGDVQAIGVAPDGRLEGESDPRRGGTALGW